MFPILKGVHYCLLDSGNGKFSCQSLSIFHHVNCMPNEGLEIIFGRITDIKALDFIQGQI